MLRHINFIFQREAFQADTPDLKLLSCILNIKLINKLKAITVIKLLINIQGGLRQCCMLSSTLFNVNS